MVFRIYIYIYIITQFTCIITHYVYIYNITCTAPGPGKGGKGGKGDRKGGPPSSDELPETRRVELCPGNEDSKECWKKDVETLQKYGYESIPINTIFSGMNIHLPAIFMFTRGTRF